MKKIFIFILLTLFIFSSALHDESADPDDNGALVCSDKTQVYSYKSVMQYTNKKEEQNKTNSITTALVENTCIRETTKGDLFYYIKFRDVKMTVRGEVQKLDKKDFADFSAFVLSSNGKLKRFWTTHREAKHSPQITALKKGIVLGFQTKINGKQRLQHSQDGDSIVHYEQRIQDDGSLLIEAIKDPKDLVKPADPHQRRRDNKAKTRKFTVVANGIETKIVQITDDKVGKHKTSELEKTVKTDKNEKSDLKSSDVFAFESRSEMILVLEEHKQEKHKNDEAVLSLLNNEENDVESQVKDLVQDLEEQDIGLDKKLIKQTEKTHKKRLKKNVDFPKLLKEIEDSLHGKRDHLSLLSKAQDYCKYEKKTSLNDIEGIFKDILSKEEPTGVERAYSKVLLTLLASIDTRESQLLMLEGLKHKRLKFNTNAALLSLRKPIKEVTETLKKESKNKKNSEIEKKNAHLTLAYVSQHVQSKKEQEELVGHLLQEMAKSQNHDDLEFHLHALSNAGEAVPLEVYSAILNSPIHLHGQVIIANSLSNRVSEEGDEETTAFIHSILSSDVDENVKIAAVKAQINREHVLQNSASILEFKQYLDSPETTTVLSKVLRAYYEEADIHPSELEDTAVLESKALFFRRIGRFFRRAVRRIGSALRRVGGHIVRAAKKVGQAIVKVGKAIGKGVMLVVNGIKNIANSIKNFANDLKNKFGKAEFEGQAVCIPANNKGDTLCMHDDEMVSFIRSQGDLSIMKWSRQFTFERLIGAKVLHLYIGAVGYGGTAIDCENNTLDAVFFARADFWGKIFNRKINVLSMYIELQKRHDQDLRDKVYVKLGPAVLVNQPFVPEKIRQAINMCEKQTKPLVTKTFDQLAQFQFTFVIVVVPVRLGFVLTAAMGIDLVYTICPSRLTLNVGVEPWFTLGVRAEAGISIFIAHGGVSLTASFNYRLKPNVGTANCNLCAIISQTIKPITIKVDLYASAFGKRWSFKIYEWSAAPIEQELFRKCLKEGKYEPFDPTKEQLPPQENQPNPPPQQEQPQPPSQPSQPNPPPQQEQPQQPQQPSQPQQPNQPQPVSNVPQPVSTCQGNQFTQQQLWYQWYYYQQLQQYYQQQQNCGCDNCC